MANEKKVYTIGGAHLDTSWVWTLETTIKEYLPATFNGNFSLFEKYPEYTFNFEGSYRYELIKEYYPEAFEKVKEYVAEGRWQPCGSCYENGDVNIPSPEALIRNVIYGNGFFRDNFGKESNDIYLPDCFGFGKALPGVAAHCGLTGFSTQKLSWGSAVPVPFDIGRWSGIDGSSLWCAIRPGKYVKVFDKVRKSSDVVKKLKENEKYGIDATVEYHGVGDRGGAPREKSVVAVINELRENDQENVKVLSSATREFFDDMEALPEEAKAKIPVHNGEFLMTEHGAGSYTSRTASKRWNRRSELLADAAERTAVPAFMAGLAAYPSAVLDTAWKKTIAHQFHDDITGTSWMVDYKRNWNDYIESMNLFSTEYTAAVKALAGAMDTSFVKGTAVVVSNPVQSTNPVEQTVSAEIKAELIPENVKVFDCNGAEVPSQLGKSDKDGYIKVIFCASVPSNGVAVYDIQPSKDGFSGETGLSLNGTVLENARYKAEIDHNGDISSVYDKKLNKELLSSPVKTELLSDLTIYEYSAWEVKYKDIMREPYACADDPVFEVVEQGAARCTLCVKRTAGGSEFRQYISLDAFGDFIRVFNEVDWQSESSNLKIRFPLSCHAEKANYDIGVGYYQRPTNTKSQFEVPAQRWADITDITDEYGVSILSDSRFGWDKPSQNTLRLTAVHTATNAYTLPTSQHVADFGLNRFSFGVFGHSGLPESTADAADRFCQPMHTFVTDVHKGKLGREFSLCSVSSNTVRILGIKKAQKSDEIVLRLCEYTGKEQNNVKAEFFMPVKGARFVTGDEMPLGGNVKTEKGALVLDFKPHEIKSLALTFALSKPKAVTYKSVALPFNACAASANCAERKALLHGAVSVPSELMPEKLLEGGIEYEFKTEGENIVVCAGQSLKVPKGTEYMHFILTNLANDTDAVFVVDGFPVSVPVQNCYEAVGAWDLIGLNETGYIKTEPQYFTFTHVHCPSGDVIGKQFRLFHACVPGKNAAEIKLPDNENIVVFSAVADKNAVVAVPADEHFDSLEKRPCLYNLSKYALRQLRESTYNKAMHKLCRFIDKTEVHGAYTEERKKMLRDAAHAVADFNTDTRKHARSARLFIERHLFVK